MCGGIEYCHLDGTVLPHERNDILAMLDRGDYDDKANR